MLAIDHVIVPVTDAAAAGARFFAAHGLCSVWGGRHDGHGTANRVIPLGSSYVEFITVVDEAEAVTSAMGRWVHGRAGAGHDAAAVCLRTDDASAVAARLGLTPMEMSRTRGDGATLSWRLVGLDQMLTEGLPFFIEWAVRPGDHPGHAFAAHRVQPAGIAWVEVGGDPDRMATWVGDPVLPLRFVGGPPGVRRAGISTDRGEIVL